MKSETEIRAGARAREAELQAMPNGKAKSVLRSMSRKISTAERLMLNYERLRSGKPLAALRQSPG